MASFISKAHTNANLFLIEGKWVLVTGAGSGCGAALFEAISGLSVVNLQCYVSPESRQLYWPPGIVLSSRAHICQLGTSLPCLALWLAKSS